MAKTGLDVARFGSRSEEEDVGCCIVAFDAVDVAVVVAVVVKLLSCQRLLSSTLSSSSSFLAVVRIRRRLRVATRLLYGTDTVQKFAKQRTKRERERERIIRGEGAGG